MRVALSYQAKKWVARLEPNFALIGYAGNNNAYKTFWPFFKQYGWHCGFWGETENNLKSSCKRRPTNASQYLLSQILSQLGGGATAVLSTPSTWYSASFVTSTKHSSPCLSQCSLPSNTLSGLTNWTSIPSPPPTAGPSPPSSPSRGWDGGHRQFVGAASHFAQINSFGAVTTFAQAKFQSINTHVFLHREFACTNFWHDVILVTPDVGK